jgi:oxalate decarboxylase
VEVGVFTAPGESAVAVIGPGDLGFAPRGSGHYLRNVGDASAHVVLIFDPPTGLFTNVDVNNFLGAFPAAWAAASLNAQPAVAAAFDYSRGGFAAAMAPSPAAAVTKRATDELRRR